MLFKLPRGHSGVAIHFYVALKAPLLNAARVTNALSNRHRAFFGAFARDIAIFHRRDLDMQIDAIEQRTGNALTITLHLERAATAFPFQIAKISAWTRVHRRDQHELGGKSHAARG